MPKSRIPSPARSQSALVTPRRAKPRGPRSVGSPARSNTSVRLTSVIQNFKNKNMDSFHLSPLNSRRSVLNDNTDIEEPKRNSWWKKLNDTSRDIGEVLENDIPEELYNVIEEYMDVEDLSQERINPILDLPDSSDNESISSIIVPQRKLFNQKENQPQPQKKFAQLLGPRESMAKLNKTSSASDKSEKTIVAGTKKLFGQSSKPRSKPAFPTELLRFSPDKTVNKTAGEIKGQVRNLFGNRAGVKRKYNFADFIASESEEELEIQPKVFGFQKKTDVPSRRVSTASRGNRDHSPTSSVTTDIDMEDWKMLPSSTMVQTQLEAMITDSPAKKARLSKLSEGKEYEATTNSTATAITNKTKQSNKSIASKNKSKMSMSKSSVNKSKTSPQRNDEENIKKTVAHAGEAEQFEQDEENNENEVSLHYSDEDPQTDNLEQNYENDVANRTKQSNESATSKNKTNLSTTKISLNRSKTSNTAEKSIRNEDVAQENENKVSDEPVNKSKERNDSKLEEDDEVQEEESPEIQNEIQGMEDENQGSEIEQEYGEREIENQESEEEEEQEGEEQENEMREMEDENQDSEQENKNESEIEKEQEESPEVENERQEIEEQNHISKEEAEQEIEDMDQGNESQKVVNESEEAESECENEEEYEENNEVANEQNESKEVEVENQSQELEEESQEMENESQEANNDEYEEENEEAVESEVEPENESQEEMDEDIDNQQDSNEVMEGSDGENDAENENHVSEEEISGTDKGTPDVTHDTSGRNRKKNETDVKSPEAILHNNTNQMESFTAKDRNRSIRRTSMMKSLNLRTSLAPPRESTGFSDGTKNSSTEGSGWDSHRITKKTLRQTFGRDFTPRKSLRALVMEKSAKRHSEFNVNDVDMPRANSTELPEDTRVEMEMDAHDVSKRTRLTTLEMYLQKIKRQNMEKRKQVEEEVRNSLKVPSGEFSSNPFAVPSRPLSLKRAKPSQSKPKKKAINTMIPLGDLPQELLEDMNYKPPRRFRPSSASWATKRLYKFFENKLEPKYDYKARIRAEKLVETIYNFSKELRRHKVAPADAVDALRHEMARLDVVRTHFDFYQFFHDYMPREVRVKVVPDVVNKIPLPRQGVFADILRGNTVQG